MCSNNVSEFNSQTQSKLLQCDKWPRTRSAVLPLQEFLQTRRRYCWNLWLFKRNCILRSGVCVFTVRGARIGGVQAREDRFADIDQLQQASWDVSWSQIFAPGATDTFACYAGFYHRFGDAQVAVAFRVRYDTETDGYAQWEHYKLARTIDFGCRNDDLGSSTAHPSDDYSAEHGATDKIQYCHIDNILRMLFIWCNGKKKWIIATLVKSTNYESNVGI